MDVVQRSEQGGKEDALKALAAAVAARPHNAELLLQRSKDIETKFGEDLRVEMAAVAGAFDATTKFTSGNGRRTPPTFVLRIMLFFMSLIRAIYSLFE